MIHRDHVRREVEAKLGRKVPDFFWEMLVEDNYVSEYEQYGDLNLLVDRVKKLERIAKRSNADIRTSNKPVERNIAPDERLRYLSEIWAVEASQLPEVVKFREKHLSNGLLTFEEVEGWIKQTQKADGPGSRWYTIALRVDTPVKNDGGFPRLRDLLQTLSQLPENELNRFISGVSAETLDYAVPKDDWVRRVAITHDGVLYRLKLVARFLERTYGWREVHGVTFVLTGLTPLLPKARVSTPGPYYRPDQRIKLELDPRLSSDEVRDIYARARKEVFKGRDRPMTKKHLELALFLVKNPYHTWREMCDLWNRQYPEWSYSIWQNFSRDARSAYRRLTGRNWVHQGKREEERSGE